MINSHTPVRSSSRRHALLALACAFGLSLMSVPALQAADKLPLTATFEKVASTEGTPIVLHLKNDSKVTLKVSGKILLSVVNHAADKARSVPEQSVEAGKVMTVTGLAGDDKVVLTAAGYAPLEVKVPFKP
jgi:hypothetical protein